MNRICVALAGTMIATTIALPASAEENTGFYAGGSLGYSMLEAAEDIEIGDVESEFEIDDEDFAWKAFLGYQLWPWLAVEGGYVDLGTASEARDAVSLDTDVDGWDAFLVGNLPLGFIDLFAKVGGIAWNLDVDLSDGADDVDFENDGEDLAYGVGLALDFRHIAIRGEAEMFDIGEVDDLFMLSVGVSVQF